MDIDHRLSLAEVVSEDTSVFRLGEPISAQSVDRAQRIEKRWIESWPSWLIDFRVGFGSLLVQYQPLLITHRGVSEEIYGILSASEDQGTGRSGDEILIPTCYAPQCSPDLEALSKSLSLPIDEIIRLHSSQVYNVVATGFSPGFAYLAETPPQIHLPRKAVPLTRIPPGSVAIAENQTVIYPKETPGGWHLIGRTKFELVKVTHKGVYPALRPGQTVRFAPISFAEYSQSEVLC